MLKSATVYGALSIPVPTGTSLHFSKNTVAGSYFLYGAVEEAKIGSTYTDGWTATNYSNLTVTEQNNTGKYVYILTNNDYLATAFEIVEAQVEIGEEKTSYEKPSGKKFIIDWSNSAGTIYGGYVDLVKGELIQTCYNMIVDENTVINRSEDKHGVYRIVYNLPYTGADKNALMCNKFGLRSRNSAMYNYPTKGLIGLGDYNTITTNLQIGAPDEEITTQEKWLNWLTVNGPIQVIYELAEPIHYFLTPTQLKTLRGTNNIWSNSNGDITVQFWRH